VALVLVALNLRVLLPLRRVDKRIYIYIYSFISVHKEHKTSVISKKGVYYTKLYTNFVTT
jgi:hypothetical protein